MTAEFGLGLLTSISWRIVATDSEMFEAVPGSVTTRPCVE